MADCACSTTPDVTRFTRVTVDGEERRRGAERLTVERLAADFVALFRGAALRALLFRAVLFFMGPRAVDERFAVLFRAVDFRAGPRFAALFRAVDFFAADLRTALLRTADFFAAFFAGRFEAALFFAGPRRAAPARFAGPLRRTADFLLALRFVPRAFFAFAAIDVLLCRCVAVGTTRMVNRSAQDPEHEVPCAVRAHSTTPRASCLRPVSSHRARRRRLPSLARPRTIHA